VGEGLGGGEHLKAEALKGLGGSTRVEEVVIKIWIQERAGAEPKKEVLAHLGEVLRAERRGGAGREVRSASVIS